MHLLVDSTGLKLSGPGEWLVEKHGTKTRRAWKKLHIGVDAGTGQILASTLTGNEVDDGSQADPLLDQVAGPLASFTGDGAYDRDDVSTAVTERHPEASIIVPPRSMPVALGRLRIPLVAATSQRRFQLLPDQLFDEPAHSLP
ncbi:MAG: transposase, partial [Pseudomonadota bacterium]|nr:transposase [Pseudomonadota bacterium]